MHDPAVAAVRQRAFRALAAPPRIPLSDWIERNIVLPSDLSAMPGKVRLVPYMRDIAAAIGEPGIERVTLCKSVRVGATTLLTAAIGYFVATDACPILCVLPTQDDCRDYMVTDVEPIFAASPVLRGLLAADAAERSTLLSRRFPGGSLRIVPARSPRSLRRMTARVLLLDEIDAMEPGNEGDPITLATRRTLTYGSRRKIIMTSTPVMDDGNILRAYATSDMRIFEVRCIECSAFNEVRWKDIAWEPDRPETAHYVCPSCGSVVEEKHKAEMVANGRWRATAPEVQGHAGFRISALVSPLESATWAKIAAEFLVAKNSPDTLQSWQNTLLGEGWYDQPGEELDDASLLSRVEPFNLEKIPADVLLLTAGCDLGDDRIEISIVGWTKTDALVLAHKIVFGSPLESATWIEVDDILKAAHRHPHGGSLQIDATIVDSGSGGHTSSVYEYTRSRGGRRVLAGKGMAGFSRPFTTLSKARNVRLILVGSDAIKNAIFNRLAAGRSIRFSMDLDANYFEQIASERRVVRYSRGHPQRSFQRIVGRRAESLDCLVYAFAARQLVNLDLGRREGELQQIVPAAVAPSVIRSRWLEGG